MAMTPPIRLQKYLAQCGIASRRKAEELIAKGLVSVDGQIVREMGTSIIPGRQVVLCNGTQVVEKEEKIYYLLNKPKGYVTTLYDPQRRPIVTSLIKECTARLFPVGRLDLDTEGALILTNDGDLAEKIQHPRNETNKTYETLVKGRPSAEKIASLAAGIRLEDKLTAPAKVTVLALRGENTLMRIIIHEGRKRQVKKMFAAIGHPVLFLRRTAYGKLILGELPVGCYRRLSATELKKIFL
jgi:23S rRNA pseudouridine2605 synthase